MSKFKVVNLIDKLFVSVCIFLIVFAWLNFYISSLWTTFFLSVIFSAASIYVLYFLIDRKQEKSNKIKHNIEDVNEKFLAFKLTPKDKKLELIKKILSIDYEASIKNGTLIYTKNNEKHLVVIATHFEKITNNEFLNIIDEHIKENINCIDIICNEYFNVKTDLLKDKKITLINKQKLYDDFFVKYEIFPSCNNINFSVSKLKFKDILKGFFVPAKAKSYFFCGLILIFSSIILPYHAYYLIAGSMLLMFSIACKLMNKFS